MGQITIQIRGSFSRKCDTVISAEVGGHAMAITRAIGFLLAELPIAIRKDHELHDEGTKPPQSDFGKMS